MAKRPAPKPAVLRTYHDYNWHGPQAVMAGLYENWPGLMEPVEVDAAFAASIGASTELIDLLTEIGSRWFTRIRTLSPMTMPEECMTFSDEDADLICGVWSR